MLTIEETRALSKVHPEFEAILNSRPPMLGGWKHDTDIQQLRAIISFMRQQKKSQQPEPETLPYIEENIQIPVRDGSSVIARVHRPRAPVAAGSPALVLFHGGGFIIGDAESASWLGNLFTELGGITVNVEYRLAPENLFPKAVEDAFDALKWVSGNANNLGINLQKGFLVGGESAGADLALICAHLYVEEDLPPLTGVYAAIPCGINDQTVPEKYKDHFFSMDQNASAPILSRESVHVVWDKYKPDFTSPLAFPIAFPDHSKVPRTYFQACGMDPIRDCALIFEQVWKDAGVPTKKDIYPGLPHGFWAVYEHLPFGQRHREDSKNGLVWLLS